MTPLPSESDLARDLADDLRYVEQFTATSRRNSPLWINGWCAALRRAMAAEKLLALLASDDANYVLERFDDSAPSMRRHIVLALAQKNAELRRIFDGLSERHATTGGTP